LDWLKVYRLPQTGRGGRGKPIVNLLPLEEAERITAVLQGKHDNYDIDLMRRAGEARDAIGSAIASFDLHLAAAAARRFLFDDLSSRWIEASKGRTFAGDPSARACLDQALDAMLRMAHPLVPFVTEEIRSRTGRPPLITSAW
jgi:valyl-tRNA synthetase